MLSLFLLSVIVVVGEDGISRGERSKMVQTFSIFHFLCLRVRTSALWTF